MQYVISTRCIQYNIGHFRVRGICELRGYVIGVCIQGLFDRVQGVFQWGKGLGGACHLGPRPRKYVSLLKFPGLTLKAWLLCTTGTCKLLLCIISLEFIIQISQAFKL